MPQDETAKGRDSEGGGVGDRGFLKEDFKVSRTFGRTSGILMPFFRRRAQWLLKKEWDPGYTYYSNKTGSFIFSRLQERGMAEGLLSKS